MDHEFWEDENELPYLVEEVRDRKPQKLSKSKRKNLDNVLGSLYISDTERDILKVKCSSFLNAKDCTGLRVEDGFDGCSFIFTRKNEYVITTDEFEYLYGSDRRRVFFDCYSYHDHEGLLRNSRFQSLIEKTGFEFIECRGGYVTEYSGKDDEFTMKDDLEVKVVFRVGLKNRIYGLNLDKMELSEDYSEYG